MLVIGVISCVDAWFNLEYPVHDGVEENPIARQILLSSNNNLALLIAAKAAGTMIALAFLKSYYYYNMIHAYIMAGTVALVQVMFLYYIMMG